MPAKQTRDSLAAAAHAMCSKKDSTFILTAVETAKPSPHLACQERQAECGEPLWPLESQLFNERAYSARMRASEHNTQHSEVDSGVLRSANRKSLFFRTDN